MPGGEGGVSSSPSASPGGMTVANPGGASCARTTTETDRIIISAIRQAISLVGIAILLREGFD
jgi:hypothetical protein